MRWLASLVKTICLLFLLLLACIPGTRALLTMAFDQTAVMPNETPPTRNTAGYTVVNLPLRIAAEDLLQALEQHVPKTYSDVDDDPTDLLVDDEIRYDLQRGPLAVSIIEKGISFSFPVTGVVRTHGKIDLRVAKIPARAHANVAGRISGDIRFEILPDWQVRPDLNFSVDFDEARIPVENLGNISLRTFLKTKLTEKIEKKRHQLVHKVLDKNRVREAVARAWKIMHRVEALHDDPLIWARVVPVKIGLMPITSRETSVLAIGLQVMLKTDIQVALTKPILTVSPLPDAVLLSQMTETFQIRVPFQIDALAINAFLEKEIAGEHSDVINGVNLSVRQAAILPAPNDGVTAIVFAHASHEAFGLDTQVRVYVNGRLAFNRDAGVIRLADVSYDAAFSRWWLGLLNWTAYPYVRHELEKHLVWPLQDEINKADAAIDRLITELVVPPGILAELSVKPPQVNHLGADGSGIYGELQLNGKLRAKLDFPVPPTPSEDTDS